MSTNTGRAPTWEITSAELIQVNGTVMTSSPGPTRSARRAISRLSVPLATVMQCRTPTYPASESSNSLISGPMMNCPCSITRRIAASIPDL